VAPSSTEAPPTTIGLPTTTVSAAKLPRTGSSTLPVLIAAIVMLVGGGAALFATRVRGRHAK
jgi:LPXTG-motif cell wall-anchored protein